MNIYTQEKICSKCEISKPLNQFYNQPKQKDGKHSWCKNCHRIKTNEYKKSPITKQKTYERGILNLYGLTPEKWQQLYDSQEGKCSICKRHQSELNKRLNVDHDHNTGVVRGLLCRDCNTGIGLLRDSPALLFRAYEYLIPTT